MGRASHTEERQLHPLCTLFPRMSGDDFAALRDDIVANGQREPIILHDGMILDGGNRYRACVDAGIEPQFMKFGGGDVVSFVLSANLHRRHLTRGQHAAIVASVTNWAAAQKHGGDRKGDQGAMLHLETVADRAAASGASVRTQKTADKVAKADPALAVAVGHGKTTLAKAAEKVGGKPRKRDQGATVAPLHADPELDNLRESVRVLAEDNDRLSDRLAVEAMDASEDEKSAAAALIAELRAEVKQLRAENDGLKAMRNSLQVEASELKKSVAYWRRKAEKVAA